MQDQLTKINSSCETSGDITQSRSKVIEEAIEKANDSKAERDIICLAMQSISSLNTMDGPQICRDVWDDQDKNERMKWQEAIEKEFHDTTKKIYKDKNLETSYLQTNAVLRANGFIR